MLLEFSAQSKIENVNFRKEKHGEDEVLAVDVKVSCELPVSMLHDFCIDQPEMTFSEFFYRDDGSLREFCLGKVDLTAEIFNHGVSFQTLSEMVEPIDLDDVKINKFSFVLLPYRKVSMTFRVQKSLDDMNNEAEEQTISKLAEMIKRGVKFTVQKPRQAELFDPETSATEDDATLNHDEVEMFAVAYAAAVQLFEKTKSTDESLYMTELGIDERMVDAIFDEMRETGIIETEGGE